MEETPNFDVLTCSQGSDLGQEQLNEIEQKAQSKSTKKATEWGLKKFDKWCEKRAISSVHVLPLPCSYHIKILCELLFKTYADTIKMLFKIFVLTYLLPHSFYIYYFKTI